MWQRWLQMWWSLFSSPHIYYQVSRWPWRVVVSYAAILAAVLGIASAIFFTQVEIPQARNSMEQASTEFQQYFPSDLKLDWTGQQLLSSSSSALPVYYPSFISADRWQLPERLAYYVPQDLSAPEALNLLPTSSLSIVTPRTLYVTDFQGGWSNVALSSAFEAVPPQSITAASLPKLLDQVINVGGQFLAFIAPLSFILFPVGVFLTRTATALVDGLLAYFLLKLQNYRFSYGQVAKMSLIITMIASSVEFVSQLLYRQSTLPVFGIVYWGYWLIIILAGRWHMLQLRRQS